MNTVIRGYLLSYGYVFLCLFGAGRLSGMLNWTREMTRKCIHVSLAVTWLILCRNLAGTVHMVIIPVTFVLLNYLSYRAGKYTSETVDKKSSLPAVMMGIMERDGEAETPGTVYYAVSITLLSIGVIIFKEAGIFPSTVGMFCLAFGDGMAGIAGKYSRGLLANHIWGSKTYGGTLCCMVCSAAVCAVFLKQFGYPLSILQIAGVGIAAGILELPGKGIDNITVPLGSALFAYCLM